jgi:hypothetical protein
MTRASGPSGKGRVAAHFFLHRIGGTSFFACIVLFIIALSDSFE